MLNKQEILITIIYELTKLEIDCLNIESFLLTNCNHEWAKRHTKRTWCNIFKLHVCNLLQTTVYWCQKAGETVFFIGEYLFPLFHNYAYTRLYVSAFTKQREFWLISTLKIFSRKFAQPSLLYIPNHQKEADVIQWSPQNNCIFSKLFSGCHCIGER